MVMMLLVGRLDCDLYVKTKKMELLKHYTLMNFSFGYASALCLFVS